MNPCISRCSSVVNKRVKVQGSRFRVNDYFNAERLLLNLRRNATLSLTGTLQSSRYRGPIIIFIVFLLTFFCLLTSDVAVAEASVTVTLAWAENQEPDVIGYKVHYGTFSKNYQYTVDVENNTSCTISGLEEGKTYYFAVTAYNSLFESDYSKELAVPIGGVGNGDELAIDFGANGLWHYDEASWSKLTPWNPEGDLAGWSGGMAVDFGGNGLWNHDGTSWSKKTPWNPGSGGLAGWSGGLAVDFDTNGLWVYDGTSWSKKTSWNPENLAGWSGGLSVDFDANGLWNYDGSSWRKLTPWNPGSGGLAGWGDGLAVDFGANGLWNYDGTTWSKKTPWHCENLADVDLN